jgi:CheY-like chemotaxis protein
LERRKVQGEIAGQAHGRVLLVEDNSAVADFSRQMLEELGYTPTLANNAAEALILIDDPEIEFDAIFSDVVMPGMSGIELGREIRRRRPDVPVVLTSGYSHILAEEGSHGFELLQKPYTVEGLTRVLQRAIRSSST